MILLALLLVVGVSASCPPRLAHNLNCPQGCYHASGIMNSDGTRPCSPVGLGYYSPPNDNSRYICEFGTYSATNIAEACSSCPAGTHSSSAGASKCDICPMGSYSNIPRSIFCSPCNPENYDGAGSDTIQVWSGKIYCAFTGVTTNRISSSPTMAPTAGLTDALTPDQPSTFLALSSLNETVSLLDQQDDQQEDHQCSSTEYQWHGVCNQCPSTIRTILHPLWIAIVVIGAITAIQVLPNTSKAMVWIGIEYLQLSYFLGLVQSSQSPHFVLQHLHRWIVSIFALDLDAGFSWQCLLGLSPAIDQVMVLMFPVVVASFMWILSQVISAIPAGPWLTVGFSLGHFKFVMTSLEALHCSDSDWFCHEPLLSSIVGIIGLTLHGGLIPVWLFWQRYSSTKNENALANSHLGFDLCWWWPGFWMLRKSILATLPLILSDHPSWILTAFLVAIMASELIQRFALPFSVEDIHHNRWFRTNTLDTILQASIIGLTGLSFLLLAMPAETLRGDGIAIAVMFLLFFVPSGAYWATAMVYTLCQSRYKNQMEEVTSLEDAQSSTSASSTSSRQRNLHRSESNSPPPLPPPSIQSFEDVAAIRYNLSLVPNSGHGDDLDIESIDDDDDLDPPNRSWRGSSEFAEWVGSQDLNIRSVLRNKPIDIHLEDYHSSSSALDDSLRLPTEDDNDDTSTLTDNNSYVRKPVPQYPMARRPRQDCASSDVRSIMESSGDGTPMIFADEEEAPVEYYRPKCRYAEERDPEVEDDNEDDDDDITEVWIDESTGLPIHDRQLGKWADAHTGLPVDSSSSSSSRSSTHSRPRPSRPRRS